MDAISSIEIPVAKSLPAIIDADDYPKVSPFKWRLSPKNYVMATYWENGKMRHVYLHRLIMNAKATDKCDHIHHDKLDNRKSELRIASSTQNQGNRRKIKTCLSKFKGVCWHKQKQKWIAHLRQKVNGKTRLKHLGYFTDEKDAARAYNKAALEYFGSFSNLNII
jgi:hypothetical protein